MYQWIGAHVNRTELGGVVYCVGIKKVLENVLKARGKTRAYAMATANDILEQLPSWLRASFKYVGRVLARQSGPVFN